MRLIDADVMEKHIMESHVFTGYFKELVQSLIWGEPTADAVEVIKCCECEYRFNDKCAVCFGQVDSRLHFCGAITNDNFYCAYGKRKEVAP